jgi:hypothetical protein
VTIVLCLRDIIEVFLYIDIVRFSGQLATFSLKNKFIGMLTSTPALEAVTTPHILSTVGGSRAGGPGVDVLNLPD